MSVSTRFQPIVNAQVQCQMTKRWRRNWHRGILLYFHLNVWKFHSIEIQDRNLFRMNKLECLERMSKNIIWIRVHPRGTWSSSVTHRRKLSSITQLAIDFAITTIVNILCSNIFLTSSTCGTFLMVTFSRCSHTLIVENFPLAPGTSRPFLCFLGHDGCSAQNL